MNSLEFWSISSYFIVICNKLGIRIASTYAKTNYKKARRTSLHIVLYFKMGCLQTSLTRNQKSLILHEAAATEAAEEQQPPLLCSWFKSQLVVRTISSVSPKEA